jgi:hypothetical protein
MVKTLTPPVETIVDPLIHRRSNKTAVNLNSINAMTRETDHKVRGQFVNVEYPGLPQKFSGKYYKGMPYFSEILKDGETCVIPLSVARWINEEFCYDQHSHITDDKGLPLKTGKKVPRGKFIIEEHLK